MKKTTFYYYVISFFCGTLFSIGLGVAGMTNPRNILDFLQMGESWSPRLLIVMGVAVVTFTFLLRFRRKLSRPLIGRDWAQIPAVGWDLTYQMLLGNVLFGIGWGLVGYCPGPALVSLVTLNAKTFAFVGSMFFGFACWEYLLRRWLAKGSLLQHSVFRMSKLKA